MKLIVMSHNYQTGAVQRISDVVLGTSGIIRKAQEYNDKNVLFCGVIYMAEDLYAMSDGVRVFIPEITVRDGVVLKPRCPMIVDQGNSGTVTMEHVRIARRMNPDVILSYINTPLSVKGETDGVYNGTSALDFIDRIAGEKDGLGTAVLIGDINVNEWIAAKTAEKYPDFRIISVPTEGVYCPPHITIDAGDFMFKWEEFVDKYGEDNVGVELHAEVNSALREFGFEKGAYFGGTDGLVKMPLNSDKKAWLIGTVEGIVDRIKMLTDEKVLFSPKAICPNMAYTTPAKVERAREILSAEGPVATIYYRYREEPYYDVEVHREELVTARQNGVVRIPAVELVIDREIKERGRRALSVLL
jgi:quinolinate synthase